MTSMDRTDEDRAAAALVKMYQADRHGWWYWTCEERHEDDPADIAKWEAILADHTEVTVTTMRDDGHTWFGAAWVRCAECGKETHHITREVTRSMAVATLAVHDSLCRACWYELAKDHDFCPDSSDHGGCTLAWGHTGRCQGVVITDEMLRRLAPPEADGECA